VDDEQYNGIFNNDGSYQVSQDANGSPGNPDWIGPSAGDQANEFAAISADGKTSPASRTRASTCRAQKVLPAPSRAIS
jgi:hypothetical protein